MKIVKRILIGILVLVVIILVSALFIKKDFSVEHQVTINKPKQEVFDYIKMLKNQGNYSYWQKKDPNMKKDYKGTDGTVGFVASWESEDGEVGTAEQEIKGITEGERMDLELRFLKPFKGTNSAYMTTQAVSENQTLVKWGFNGKMPYPVNFMLVFMNMDKKVGGQLQTGLDNLKSLMEAGAQ